MATRVTREQQEELGFESPQEFSDALTGVENALEGDTSMADAGSVPDPTTQPSPTTESDVETSPNAQDVEETPQFQPTEFTEEQEEAVRFLSDVNARSERVQQEQTQQEEVSRRSELEQRLQENEQDLTQAQLQAREEAGVGETRRQVDDIQAQIRERQLQHRRRIERLQTAEGMTSGQRNAAISDIQRKQASELADLSIIEQTRLARYDTAQAIAQQKAEILTAPIKSRIDRLEVQFEQNEALFTAKEKADYQSALQTQRDQYNAALEQAQELENTKAELVRNASVNGAPNEVLESIQRAENQGQAQQAAGQFGMSVDDRLSEARISKINADIAKIYEDMAPEEADASREKVFQIENGIESLNNVINKKKETFSSGDPEGGVLLLEKITAPSKIRLRLQTSPASRQERQDTISEIQKIVDAHTMDNLIKLKKRGATFGSLSEGELGMIASAASEIGNRVIKDNNGKVIGYYGTSEKLKDNLEEIKSWYKIDYENTTGQPYPEETEIEVDESGNIIVGDEETNDDFFKSWQN